MCSFSLNSCFGHTLILWEKNSEIAIKITDDTSKTHQLYLFCILITNHPLRS